MGCNCKGETIDSILENNEQSKSSRPLGELIVKYSLKMIVFLLFLLALPIVNLYIIYMAFSMLVMNKNIDVKPLMLAIGRKFQNNDMEEYISDEEYETLTEDDVMLTNVETIKPKLKK